MSRPTSIIANHLVGLPQDSVVVESPLAGGVGAVVRFLLGSVPQWVQIAGVCVGLGAAAVAAVALWRRRTLLISWLLTRSRNVKIALATAAGIAVLGAAGFSVVGWNYTQHDNSFCSGCHVMDPAVGRFTTSEHRELSCHDCHQQSIFASMWQLYLWVAERPDQIGEHAPVPNRVCETCHVTGEPEVWQRIRSTAGHRVHLESDSSTLRDVMCVTCHALEVHRFAPVDSTCAQADCHVSTGIVLGAMANQTALHCVTCHQFTAEVPALATRDSASGTLVPGVEECFSCHEMQAVLADFDPAFDPHRGTCGMCHNPHEQERAAEAAQTCATANCHLDWRAEPFHTGTRHADVGRQCIMCHEPHRARVDASDCAGCHAAVAAKPEVPRAIRERLRRIAPFDTAAAIRRQALSGAFFGAEAPARRLRRPALKGGPDERLSRRAAPAPSARFNARVDVSPPVELWSRAVFPTHTLPPDSFSHAQHADLSCLTCHVTSSGHGRLTFQPPRGCQICHHQAPGESECADCHAPDELGAALRVTARFAVAERPVRTRELSFEHATHREVRCVECHVEPVTLAPGTPAAECTDCHDQHHQPARACAVCHGGATVAPDHSPPVDAHVSCDACHQAATVARLLPDRAFCITCHQPQAVDHYADRECTVCHFQASPEEFRSRLSTPGEGT